MRTRRAHKHQAGHATEEHPGVLQTLDQVRQFLRERHMHVLMPTGGQHHVQPPQQPPAAVAVGNQPKPTEVDLAEDARRWVRKPHRDAALIQEAAPHHREPVQAAVRHPHPVARQQSVHLRQAQAPPLRRGRRQPRPNVLLVRRQQHLAVARGAIASDTARARHRARQLIRDRQPRPPPQRLGPLHDPTDRLPGVPRDALDLRTRLPTTDPLQHHLDLEHGHLSVRHGRTPNTWSALTMTRRPRPGSRFSKHCQPVSERLGLGLWVGWLWRVASCREGPFGCLEPGPRGPSSRLFSARSRLLVSGSTASDAAIRFASAASMGAPSSARGW